LIHSAGILQIPAIKNEVPVPDALKGKEITILCRAVDSAYSTLLAPGQVIATLVAWKLPGIGKVVTLWLCQNCY